MSMDGSITNNLHISKRKHSKKKQSIVLMYKSTNQYTSQTKDLYT